MSPLATNFIDSIIVSCLLCCQHVIGHLAKFFSKRTALEFLFVSFVIVSPLHDSIQIRPALIIQLCQLLQLQKIYMSHFMHKGRFICFLKQGNNILTISCSAGLAFNFLIENFIFLDTSPIAR